MSSVTPAAQRITLPYGSDRLEADLSHCRILATLDIGDVPAVADAGEALRDALACPIGQEGAIAGVLRPGENVAIIVSDSFRYTAVELLLPSLISELNAAGIRDEDICFVFSTGTHRAPTEQEAAKILGGPVYTRFRARAYSHDPADAAGLVFAGATSRGTPVYLNRRVMECDRVIVTGAVVFHYFGGFGGGRKSIVPGIAGVETIARNHARNLHAVENRLDPAVRIGALDGNPVAEDMLEAARCCRCDLLINTVLNRRNAIAGIFAGELDAAHRAAAEFAHGIFAVPIRERADLVIASAGAAKNFIQSHKALFNAFQAVKPGGRIVFLARAPEGFGGNKFTKWLEFGSRDAIIAELRKNAEINGQTALSTVEKAPITLFLTELAREEVALMGGRKAGSFQNAIDLALEDLRAAGIESPTTYLMPSASYSVPFLHPA